MELMAILGEYMRQVIINKIKNAHTQQIALQEAHIVDKELHDILHLIHQSKPNIDSILLSNNKISDEGAIILSQELYHFKNLKTIDLQFNQIGKKGMIALMTLQANQPNLLIALHGNKIRDEGEMEEIKIAATKSSLSFSNRR